MKNETKIAAGVKAIREDSMVGRGSCSVIDECWEDAEIAAVLRDGDGDDWRETPTSVKGAVAWARRDHRRSAT